jgi:PTH1 family peptidyl-tRNA hydrolase
MSCLKAIVGLGNPGSEYQETRHNIGFSCLDYLADKFSVGSGVVWQRKFDGLYSSINLNGDKIHLLKPQTYMNLSGRSVLAMQSFYKLSLDDLIVIYDDIDMELAKVRFKFAGGSGGHNGIKSIDSSVGQNYHRLKIGIGRPEFKGDVSNYVLQKFTGQERAVIDCIYNKISQNLDLLVEKDFANFLSKL